MASFLARETQSAAVKHDMHSRKSPIYKHIRGEYGLLTDTLHYCFIVTKKTQDSRKLWKIQAMH